MSAPGPTVQLVVNADDLGLHADINRGIAQAHREGIVTSASVSAAGAAFGDALTVLRECPELDVGVHLTLVEERPVAPPSDVRSLLASDGTFPRSWRELAGRVLLGRVDERALRTELRAQLDKVHEAGLHPTHLDAHQHVHLLPAIRDVVLELAADVGISWVRRPRFVPFAGGEPSSVVLLGRIALNLLSSRTELGPGLRTADATPGLAFSGCLTAERILESVEGARHARVAELVVHPAVETPALRARYRWGYSWGQELAALCDPAVRVGLAEAGFVLCGFSQVGAGTPE